MNSPEFRSALIDLGCSDLNDFCLRVTGLVQKVLEGEFFDVEMFLDDLP